MIMVTVNVFGKRIELKDKYDIETLYYFVSLADEYRKMRSQVEPQYNKTITNKVDFAEAKKAYDFVDKIKSVNGLGGYVVLEDDTIRCTPAASSWVAQFDECHVNEINTPYW